MPATKEHYAKFDTPTETFILTFNEERIAETNQAVILNEFNHSMTYPPSIYFPPQAMDLSQIEKTDQKTNVLKGEASYWSFRDSENAVWSYETPDLGFERIRGYFGFNESKGFKIEKI